MMIDYRGERNSDKKIKDTWKGRLQMLNGIVCDLGLFDLAFSSSWLMGVGLQMSMIGSGRGSSAKRSSGSERKAELVRVFLQAALAR